MISGRNFTGTDIADIPVDTEYQRCNFSRRAPIDIGGGVMRGHRLFPGDDTPRTFTDCNLVNCEPPPGSTVVRCNTTIVDTRIVSSTETITLPDASEIVVEHHSSIFYGKYNPATETYDDEVTPVETEID